MALSSLCSFCVEWVAFRCLLIRWNRRIVNRETQNIEFTATTGRHLDRIFSEEWRWLPLPQKGPMPPTETPCEYATKFDFVFLCTIYWLLAINSQKLFLLIMLQSVHMTSASSEGVHATNLNTLWVCNNIWFCLSTIYWLLAMNSQKIFVLIMPQSVHTLPPPTSV